MLMQDLDNLVSIQVEIWANSVGDGGERREEGRREGRTKGPGVQVLKRKKKKSKTKTKVHTQYERDDNAMQCNAMQCSEFKSPTV